MNEPTFYRQDDGRLRVEWPAGDRPRTVPVASELIDGWVETHNALLDRAERAEADADAWAAVVRSFVVDGLASSDALPRLHVALAERLADHDEAVAQR